MRWTGGAVRRGDGVREVEVDVVVVRGVDAARVGLRRRAGVCERG